MGLRSFFDSDKKTPIIRDTKIINPELDMQNDIVDFATNDGQPDTAISNVVGKPSVAGKVEEKGRVSPKLDLVSPKAPNKIDYLDKNSIDAQRQNAQGISKANAMISVVQALMDASQINNESYQPMTGVSAQIGAGIPQFLQNLNVQEQSGMNNYLNAMNQYNNADTSVQNQEKVANYNSDRQKEQEVTQEKRDATTRYTNMANTLLTNGAELEDVNTYLRSANMPEITSKLAGRGGKGSSSGNGSGSEKSEESTNPIARAGMKLMAKRMANDPSSALGGTAISRDATMLEKYGSKKDVMEYIAEQEYTAYINEIGQRAQKAVQANDLDALSATANDMSEAMGWAGYSQKQIDAELTRLYPTLFNPQLQVVPQVSANSSPIQGTANAPSVQSTYNSPVVDKSQINVRKPISFDKETGKMKNVDSTTQERIGFIRNKMNDMDFAITQIEKQLTAQNLSDPNKVNLETARKALIENRSKFSEELKTLFN